jgi:hypothetical protein
LRLKSHQDSSFPSHNVFRRFGKKAELVRRVLEYAKEREGLDDIIDICEPLCQESADYHSGISETHEEEYGFVYLAKFRQDYKIGRTNYPERRTVEINLQLPEKLKMIHKIKTDDPVGIEAYWHKRFAERRKKGEWFMLSASDVKTFCRRRFM